jgi:hypothetical protein
MMAVVAVLEVLEQELPLLLPLVLHTLLLLVLGVLQQHQQLEIMVQILYFQQ